MWHLLGDSFLNNGFALQDLRAQAGLSISMTQDGVGGTSITQQAARFAADPASWNRLLIINDGGFDGTAEEAIAAIDGIRSNLTHDYWLYMEPMIHAEVIIGHANRAATEAKHQAMALALGDRFVPCQAALIAAAISDPEDPGYEQDQIDAANGVYPASCRNDNSHPSLKGIAVRNTQVLARMQALGWLT